MEKFLEPSINKTLTSLEDRISKLNESLNTKNDELVEIKLSLTNLQSSMKGLMISHQKPNLTKNPIDKKDGSDAKSKLKSILKDSSRPDNPSKPGKVEVKDVFQKVRKINHIITGKKPNKVDLNIYLLYFSTRDI